jgi:hypothetical protein
MRSSRSLLSGNLPQFYAPCRGGVARLLQDVLRLRCSTSLPSQEMIKDEFVGSPYPAWTAIGVTELITEGTLLEIRVIAKRA